MEPSEQCNLENSLNSEPTATGDAGKMEIHSSASSSHNEETVIGYIELDGAGVGCLQYDGNILVENEIILFVRENDPSEESSADLLAVENFKNELAVHEISTGERIETEEVSHNCANPEIFIDDSQYQHIIVEGSENPNLGDEEQSVQSSEEKEAGTELLIVPTSSMSSSQLALLCEQPKHRKLMQLACIAHELQSADQKNTSTDSDKDMECSSSIPEHSVIATEQHMEDDSNATTLLLSNGSESTKVDETDESMPESITGNECQINNVSLDSEINSSNTSTYLCYETARTTGSAISVIHTATSELIESVSESNFLKQCASDDLKSNCEIKSEKDGGIDAVSNVSLKGKHHSTFEQIVNKDSYETLPEQDQNNIPSVIVDSSMNNKESDVSQSMPSEMNCSPDNDDETSESLLENHEKLSADSVDLEGEKSLCSETDAYEIEHMDEYSQSSSRESCVVVVERDESKVVEDESNFSASNLECTPIEDDVVMTDNAAEVTEDKCLPSFKSNSNTYASPSDVSIKNFSDFTNGENTCESEAKPCQTNDEYLLHSSGPPADDKENFENSVFCRQKQSSLPASHESSMFSKSKKIDASDLSKEIQECGSNINDQFNLCVKNSNSECQNFDFISNKTEDEISDMEMCESKNGDLEGHKNVSLQTAIISTVDGTKTGDENSEKMQKGHTVSRINEHVFEFSDSDKEHVTEKALKLDVPKPNLENDSKKLTEVEEIEIYESSLSNTNEDSIVATGEETLVKPPKKTYIRKRKIDESTVLDDKSISKDKIELFSEDIAPSTFNSNNEVCEPASESNVCEETSQVSEQLDDSDLKVSAVSTTYVTKKKPKIVPPIVRENRTRSLRPRSKGSKESLENESEDISLIESKSKDSLSASNAESICWGDYLMQASFANTTQIENKRDSPVSPRLNIASKEALLTPSIRKRRRPKKMKTNVRSKLDWERLMKSSPAKLKREIITKRKLREKVKKQFMSHLNSKSFIGRQMLTMHSLGTVRKRSRPKPIIQKHVKKVIKNKKTALIKDFTILKYKNLSLDSSGQTQGLKASDESFAEYSCTHCNFLTNRVNNLLLHLKFCSNKQTLMQFMDCRLDDMDRRQRIRGDDSGENSRTKEKAKSPGNLPNGSINDIRDDDEPECSGFSQEHYNSDEDESSIDVNTRTKRTFGFSEDDIVWTKVSDVFWPGLVVELKKRKALVLLINSPFEKLGIKVRLDRLHTYDDVLWNRKILKRSEAFEFYDKFVRAVQKAETFVRRKWLDVNVRGREYFKFPENVNFISESEDDSDIEFDSQDQSSQDDFLIDTIDEAQMVQIIKQGRCNTYLQGILTGDVECERHKIYFSNERHILSEDDWFGPLHNQQLRESLYSYLLELFKTHMGDESYSVTYIYQVWIPEAIKKSVSLLKAIPLNEADDLIHIINSRCDEITDPEMNIEDIQKLYE